MLVPLGGWKQEQSSLVAYMDVSILTHKRPNTLVAWDGVVQALLQLKKR